MKAMVDSGQVRVEIRSFSLGSVVVNFTLIFTPSQGQDISEVSTAVLNSLMNSTKYTVDRDNTVFKGMSFVQLCMYMYICIAPAGYSTYWYSCLFLTL